MKVIACEQRTPEWIAARLGRLTSSRVSDAFSTRKDKQEAAGRRNLRVQLVLERLTGRSHESGYTNAHMERGTELEPAALAAYEVETGIFIEPVGFIQHDELMVGCSPDGLTADGEGMVEIKCPMAATHLDYLRGELPREYFLQIVNSLWLTGRKWADFVSFSPDFPESLRLKRTRLYAREIDFAAHELMVRAFLADVDRELEAVRALMAGAAA